MLYYRGDKFVKGKKFTINEAEYKFIRKTKDKELVFESTKDKSTLKILESKFNGVETLVEKINQENKEINELIGKILRSKSLARKNEDLLAKYGIKVNYDRGQGVTLIGPNGKSLSSSTREVEGPTKPGHSRTHERQDSWYTSRLRDYTKYRDEAQAELEKLQAMDRDDIIRKYNDKSTEEALAAHAAHIERQKKYVADYDKRVKEYENNVKRNVDEVKRDRRAGHKGTAAWSDRVMSKDDSNEKVDYLNYLTKADLGNPTKSRGANSYVGDNKQYTNPRDSYYSSHYYGKHGQPNNRSEKMNKYAELKNNISMAQRDVNWSSQGSGYGGYKSDEDLEKEIQKMRDELEARIESLRSSNEHRKANNARDTEKLQAREKELDDYLKSLGIRESVRASMVKKAVLVEAAKLNEGHEKHYEYVKETLDNLFEEILNFGMEMDSLGYTALARKLEKCLSIIEDYSFASDSIYTKEDGTAGRIMTAKEAKDSGIYDVIRKKKSEKK